MINCLKYTPCLAKIPPRMEDANRTSAFAICAEELCSDSEDEDSEVLTVAHYTANIKVQCTGCNKRADIVADFYDGKYVIKRHIGKEQQVCGDFHPRVPVMSFQTFMKVQREGPLLAPIENDSEDDDVFVPQRSFEREDGKQRDGEEEASSLANNKRKRASSSTVTVKKERKKKASGISAAALSSSSDVQKPSVCAASSSSSHYSSSDPSIDVDRPPCPIESHLHNVLDNELFQAICKGVGIPREVNQSPATVEEYNQELFRFAISGRDQTADAKNLAKRLLSCGLKPTLNTFNALIAGCRVGMHHSEVIRLLDITTKSGLVPDIISFNFSIFVLAQAKNLEMANTLFNNMKTQCQVAHSVTSYNIIIWGVVDAGLFTDALSFFTDMREEGLSPNFWTFLLIIIATCHLVKSFRLKKDDLLGLLLAWEGQAGLPRKTRLVLEVYVKEQNYDAAIQLLWCLEEAPSASPVNISLANSSSTSSLIFADAAAALSTTSAFSSASSSQSKPSPTSNASHSSSTTIAFPSFSSSTNTNPPMSCLGSLDIPSSSHTARASYSTTPSLSSSSSSSSSLSSFSSSLSVAAVDGHASYLSAVVEEGNNSKPSQICRFPQQIKIPSAKELAKVLAQSSRIEEMSYEEKLAAEEKLEEKRKREEMRLIQQQHIIEDALQSAKKKSVEMKKQEEEEEAGISFSRDKLLALQSFAETLGKPSSPSTSNKKRSSSSHSSSSHSSSSASSSSLMSKSVYTETPEDARAAFRAYGHKPVVVVGETRSGRVSKLSVRNPLHPSNEDNTGT